MNGRTIPVYDSLLVELGDERTEPDPSTPDPRLTTIVQVCTCSNCRLAIVGVAEVSLSRPLGQRAVLEATSVPIALGGTAHPGRC